MRHPTGSSALVSSSESDLIIDDRMSTVSPLTISDNDNDSDADIINTATTDLLGRAIRKSRKLDENGEEDVRASLGDDDCEEEEQEEEFEAEEDRPFQLEFTVPVGAASDTITMSSDIGYTEFFQNIADTMDIRKKDLNIAYKLNCSTKDELPLVLKAPLHVVRLFSAAHRELEARENGKSKVKKELKAIIIDLRPKPGKEKPGKSTKKPASKSKHRETEPNSDEDDDESQAQRGKKSKAEEVLRELEDMHRCQKHDSFCYVAKNGEHIPLSTANLSLWTLLFVEGSHESMTKPPAALSLPIEGGTDAPARSRRPQQPQNPFPGSAYTYPFYLPPPGPYPHAYYPPPPAPYLEPRPKSPVQAAVPTPSVSTDLDQDELPTLFPVIKDWLLELNTSEHGNDGHKFSQFGPTLRTNGFVRIIQLADKGDGGAATLREICPGMLMGVSKLLMKYALTDVRKIRKQEQEWKAAMAAA